ncbi:hypothetical protein MCEMSE15_01713 [Fimbriimonadaceae bacterium]
MVTLLTALTLLNQGGNLSHTYTASQANTPVYTGLYNSSGTEVTTDSYVTKFTYKLSYNTTDNYPLVTYSGPSDVWKTELTVHFNNSSWQNHKYSTGLGFQVMNFILTNNTTNNTTAVSQEIDYFADPRPNGETASFVWFNSSTSLLERTVAYNDIKPRWMRFSEFTTISSDGKSATRVWYSSPTSKFPWASGIGFPSSTTVTSETPYPTSFVGVVWMFPQAYAGGFSSVDTGVTSSYAAGGN